MQNIHFVQQLFSAQALETEVTVKAKESPEWETNVTELLAVLKEVSV